MRFLPFSLLAVALLLSACASGFDPGSQSDTAERRSELISQEELASKATLSAFEAIRLLRPRWLQRRGNVNIGGPPLLPVVMVDRVRFGALDHLKQITVQDVESIRFIPGRDATTIYGTGYGGGIIEVTTRHH
jgi:hypothetical protein